MEVKKTRHRDAPKIDEEEHMFNPRGNVCLKGRQSPAAPTAAWRSQHRLVVVDQMIECLTNATDCLRIVIVFARVLSI